MLATITLSRHDTFEMKRSVTGETTLVIPTDVLRRAYCDIVSEEMMRARQSQPKEGVLQ